MKDKLIAIKRVILLFLFIQFTTGCVNNSKIKISESKYQNSKIIIPKVFFKKFSGMLDLNRTVSLYMTRNTNVKEDDFEFNCVIEDSNIDIPIICLGSLLSKNNFKFISHEDKTVLIGSFITDSKIKIQYCDPKTEKVFVVELNQSKEFISIVPKNYYAEILEKHTDDSFCDSTMSHINIDLLLFKSEDKFFSKKLNITVKEALIVDENETYESYIQKTLPNVKGYLFSRIDVVYFENNFLTLQLYDREAACGAAHGDYFISYINYDLFTGKSIRLEDIFDKNSFAELETICEEKFKEKYKLNDQELEEFYLPKDFAIYRNGISFILQPYNDAIQIYTGGTPEVFIPFSEINKLMNFKTELASRLLYQKN